MDPDVQGSIPIRSFHGENTTNTSCIGCILKGPCLGEVPCCLYDKRKWGIM